MPSDNAPSAPPLRLDQAYRDDKLDKDFRWLDTPYAQPHLAQEHYRCGAPLPSPEIPTTDPLWTQVMRCKRFGYSVSLAQRREGLGRLVLWVTEWLTALLLERGGTPHDPRWEPAEELAEVLELPETKLNKLCREHCGQTAREIWDRLRLGRFVEALRAEMERMLHGRAFVKPKRGALDRFKAAQTALRSARREAGWTRLAFAWRMGFAYHARLNLASFRALNQSVQQVEADILRDIAAKWTFDDNTCIILREKTDGQKSNSDNEKSEIQNSHSPEDSKPQTANASMCNISREQNDGEKLEVGSEKLSDPLQKSESISQKPNEPSAIENLHTGSEAGVTPESVGQTLLSAAVEHSDKNSTSLNPHTDVNANMCNISREKSNLMQDHITDEDELESESKVINDAHADSTGAQAGQSAIRNPQAEIKKKIPRSEWLLAEEMPSVGRGPEFYRCYSTDPAPELFCAGRPDLEPLLPKLPAGARQHEAWTKTGRRVRVFAGVVEVWKYLQFTGCDATWAERHAGGRNLRLFLETYVRYGMVISQDMRYDVTPLIEIFAERVHEEEEEQAGA